MSHCTCLCHGLMMAAPCNNNCCDRPGAHIAGSPTAQTLDQIDAENSLREDEAVQEADKILKERGVDYTIEDAFLLPTFMVENVARIDTHEEVYRFQLEDGQVIDLPNAIFLSNKLSDRLYG